MDSPETLAIEVQPQSAVNTQTTTPESSAQQPQNATPLNSIPLPKEPQADTDQGSETGEKTTTPEPREEDGAAQTNQEEPQPTANETKEPTQPSQLEESKVNEEQEDKNQEKQAQLATQINLLLTEAVKIANESRLEEDKKTLFLQQIGQLQQEIAQKKDDITYPELGARLSEIGKAVDDKKLQILGLELQMLFVEEKNKENFQRQIDELARDDETLKGQLQRLYKLFIGKEFDEANPQIYKIAEGLSSALTDENKRKTLLETAEKLGYNQEEIEILFNQMLRHRQQLEQAVKEAQKEKRSIWKTAGALGILGVIILLFTLIRSALAGERE